MRRVVDTLCFRACNAFLHGVDSWKHNHVSYVFWWYFSPNSINVIENVFLFRGLFSFFMLRYVYRHVSYLTNGQLNLLDWSLRAMLKLLGQGLLQNSISNPKQSWILQLLEQPTGSFAVCFNCVILHINASFIFSVPAQTVCLWHCT